MARIKSRNLYDLIQSLDKNEKRYFKLLYSGTGDHEDKKMLLLFDCLNKQKDFDEEAILEKEKSIKPSQLSNLKAYLYEKILQSIRMYNASKMSDIQIREQIDFAQLLFKRRLYVLGKSSLEKAKKMAKLYNNLELQLEIIKIEKNFLMQASNDSEKVDSIITEARMINSQINNIHIFSNLSMKLNSFYRKIGYIRDEGDYLRVKEYFYSSLPAYEEEKLSTPEKTFLYKLFINYHFFIQDFDNGYTYAKKLEELFEKNESLLRSHAEVYLTSLNNILSAQYKLFRYSEFLETVQKLHSIKENNLMEINEEIRIRLMKYFYVHEINRYFMEGKFSEGVDYIMEKNQTEVADLFEELDEHSITVLNYKIACLYFGAGNYRQAVRWLNKIINISNPDIREDIHCFARIMNLVCHYELGNFDVIKYYIITTYRFLLKKDDLRLFQKFILGFLKELDEEVVGEKLIEKFSQLKMQLIPLVNSAYEKRAFIYFDIISWLESKIENKSVQEVIQEKFRSKVKEQGLLTAEDR